MFFLHILTGGVLSLGLKFAGTAEPEAFRLLMEQVKTLLKMRNSLLEVRRSSLLSSFLFSQRFTFLLRNGDRYSCPCVCDVISFSFFFS